ncbi:hypothetical protein CRYUN_Cryun13aG0037700 [Craigia yunnanensis]
MEANIGMYPSYSWRSICAGKEILQRGTRWRTGNGQQVGTMQWDPELIEQIFPREIEQAICAIPLSRSRAQDVMWLNTQVNSVMDCLSQLIASVDYGMFELGLVNYVGYLGQQKG